MSLLVRRKFWVRSESGAAAGPVLGPACSARDRGSIVWGVIAELANDIAWDAVGAQIEPYLRQHA